MMSRGGGGAYCFNPIINAALISVKNTVSLGKVDVQIGCFYIISYTHQ